MPALDSIAIRGFKSIASVDVKLRPIDVLIGPNGSGKSNFIEVFSFLRAIRAGHLGDYVVWAGGAGALLHFGSAVTSEMRIAISFQEEKNRYEITLAATDADQLYPVVERVGFWDKKGGYPRPYWNGLPRRGIEAGISDPNAERISYFVREHLDRWRLYHFHDAGTSSPLKQTADVHDNRFLRADGSNLPSFLYYLRQRHYEAYSSIRRTVQLVAPFFDDFALEPQRLNEDKIRLAWRHKGSDAYFDAASLSDGTLRFIALATLLLQPVSHRPSVILIDEPELGLHPYALTLLASLVKRAATRTQVILATQSPSLLDHFSPEDVLVADRVGGATQFTRLKPDELAIWLEDYSLGQLWEKNELGGRPGSG